MASSQYCKLLSEEWDVDGSLSNKLETSKFDVRATDSQFIKLGSSEYGALEVGNIGDVDGISMIILWESVLS